MTDHVTPTPMADRTVAHPSRWTIATTARVLAVVAAALLAVDAYVHLNDAAQYDTFRSSVMSEGTLFRIQGVVAIVVAIALLIWLSFSTSAIIKNMTKPRKASMDPRRIVGGVGSVV